MNLYQTRHFFQSDEWSRFQEALGKRVIKRSGPGWNYMAIIETGDGYIGRLFKRLYVPYGPSYKNQPALEMALDDLNKVALKNGVDYIRIEPVGLDANKQIADIPGYRKLANAYQPNLTLVANLDRPFDDILSDMTKTNRYLWNKASQNKLNFSISEKPEDLDQFLNMMKATERRTGTSLRSKNYFKTLLKTLGPLQVAHIAYVYHDHEPLVGSLFVDDLTAKVRYYLYAGSYDAARQYSANSPLVIYLMFDAKKRGLDMIDFFGVSPINLPNHRWAGLSQFKRSFGGVEKTYVGSLEKPVINWRYRLMLALRKLA